jgi:hypothetical protein
MNGEIHLAVAYIGMITALGIWTWTVFTRSNKLEEKIKALELALLDSDESE